MFRCHSPNKIPHRAPTQGRRVAAQRGWEIASTWTFNGKIICCGCLWLIDLYWRLSIAIHIYIYILSIYLSIYLYIYISVCVFIRIYICVCFLHGNNCVALINVCFNTCRHAWIWCLHMPFPWDAINHSEHSIQQRGCLTNGHFVHLMAAKFN